MTRFSLAVLAVLLSGPAAAQNLTVVPPGGDRVPETQTVRDKGAKLDGSSDSAAFRAARAAAPRNGVVLVPQGCINADVPIDAAKTVLWQMSGNVYCGGSAPVAGIGSDIVETFLPDNGGKFIGQTNTTANSKQLETLQRSVTHSGGGKGVLDTLRINTAISGNPAAYVFGLTSVITDKTPAVNQDGNNVAIYGQYNRESGGVPGWSMALETNDFTNKLSSQSAGTLGAEILLKTNRADDSNRRIVLDLVLGKALPRSAEDKKNYEKAEVYSFVRAGNFFGDPNAGHAKFGYTMEGPVTEAVFDASRSIFVGADAIAYRLKSDSKIDFRGDSSRSLFWNSGGALQYLANKSILFEIKDDGTVNMAGTVRVGGVNQPDQSPPTSTSDPSGSLGDVRFSGSNMYRKTASGWLRYSGSKF